MNAQAAAWVLGAARPAVSRRGPRGPGYSARTGLVPAAILRRVGASHACHSEAGSPPARHGGLELGERVLEVGFGTARGTREPPDGAPDPRVVRRERDLRRRVSWPSAAGGRRNAGATRQMPDLAGLRAGSDELLGEWRQPVQGAAGSVNQACEPEGRLRGMGPHTL